MDKEQKTLKAAIYIRVSTLEQDKQWNGPEYQMSKIKSYIESRDFLEFAGNEHIYKDVGISWASPTIKRPGLSQLMKQAKHAVWEKPFDVVIVYKIDRFARSLTVLLDIVDDLKQYDIGFISTQESLDTWSPFGKAMLGILWVFSELEKSMIQERTTLGRLSWLESWSRQYQRVYGYRKNNSKEDKSASVVKKEAEVIRDIYKMFVYDKRSVQEICNILMEEWVPSPAKSTDWFGGHKTVKDPYFWYYTTVKKILTNELYIGKYYYNKTKTIITDVKKNDKEIIQIPKEDRVLSEHRHDPIVTEWLFNKAQQRFEESANIRMRYNNYPLSWLLKCDCCKKWKKRWRVSWTGLTSRGVKYYQCTGKKKKKGYKYKCPTVDVKADDLNTLVKNEIQMLINDPDAIHRAINKADNLLQHKEFIEDSISKINSKIKRVATAQDNLTELRFEQYMLSKKDYESEMKKLEKKMDDLKAQRDNLYEAYDQYTNVEAQKRLMEALSRIWDNLEAIFNQDELLKEFLRLLIDEIVVFSEPNDKMKLNWRPRKDGTKAYIPHTLLIKFRLPQDFLNELYISPNDDLDEWEGTTNSPKKPKGNWWWGSSKSWWSNNTWWTDNNVQHWPSNSRKWTKVQASIGTNPFMRLHSLITYYTNGTPISTLSQVIEYLSTDINLYLRFSIPYKWEKKKT